MRLLLDTHVFLWWVLDDRRLPASAARAISEADAVYVSSASIWEVAIKYGIGKLDADPQQLAEAIKPSGFDELPVRARHAAAVVSLPAHHNDPFDRLLVAQALAEPLTLVTVDTAVAAYGPPVKHFA